MRIKVQKLKGNNDGMVAIIVTMILMIVITLVVSGFALIVRREQRQSLDRQLSTQAFYAAEAGVGDVAAWRRDTANQDKTVNKCDDGVFPYASFDNGVVAGDNVKYTCVLVDPKPIELIKDNVPPGEGFILPIKTDAPIASLEVSWDNISGNNFISNTGYPLPQNSPLPTALLQSTLIEGFSSGLKTRDQLEATTRTAYMYPSAGAGGAGTVNFSNPADNGELVSGNCNTSNRNSDSYACRVRISGLGSDSYYLYIKALYQRTNIKVTAYSGSGTKLEFNGAQTVVDSTGKASDVLRRIQVRLPASEDAVARAFDLIRPTGALETTDDLCKRLLVTTNQYRDQCGPNTWVPMPAIPPVSPGGGGGVGNALIGECLPNEPPDCGKDTGTATEYIFSQSFPNNSQNAPGVVASCRWDWGDGTHTDFPPTNNACKYGNRVNHVYHDYTAEIDRPNNPYGCYTYTVKLTMYFTAASGIVPNYKEDISTARLPRGSANDIPNGRCHILGYKPYPNP